MGPAQPTYVDKALTMGVTGTRPYVGDTTLPSTAWHSEFQDVNNDGRVDLFVAKGNVEAMPDFAARDPSDLFLGTVGDKFTEAGQEAGIDSFARARGAAIVDLNGDGMLDIAVVDRLTNVRVYRNVGSGTAGAPQPIGQLDRTSSCATPAPTADAIGSWIEVRANGAVQQRELTIGGGHVSGELVPVHFGLGQSTSAAGPHHLARRNEGGLAVGDQQHGVSDRARGAALGRDSMSAGTSRRHARLDVVDLPYFGPPDAEPELPAALYAARLERLRERMDARRRTNTARLRRPRAQRQHLVPDRLRSALRGGAADPRSRPSGDSRRQRELGHGRSGASCRLERHLFQDFSLPGQPRDRSRPLSAILAEEAIGANTASA